MDDHEARCAIELGYNWCTCIRYAEQQVARGFELHVRRSGEVLCPSGHEEWFLRDTGCSWCKAVV